MKAEIIDDDKIIVSPSTMTELYAVKKFIEDNKNAELEDVFDYDMTEVLGVDDRE